VTALDENQTSSFAKSDADCDPKKRAGDKLQGGGGEGEREES